MSTDHPTKHWLAPLASLVVPGAGQLLQRRPVRAALYFVPFALVAVVALVTAGRGTVGILELLVQPSTLWAVFGLNLVLLAVRIASVVDAAWVARPHPSRRRLAVVSAFVLLTALPHLVVGAYSLEAIDLLGNVFGATGGPSADELRAEGYTDEDFGPVAPATTLAPVPTTTTTTAPPPPVTIRPNIPSDEAKLLIPEGDRNPVRPVIVPPEPAYYEAPFEPDRVGDERITVLLAGGDAGPGRRGLRTDVMMVATLDPATGWAAIFGVPRNLGRVPLPDWMAEEFTDLEDRYWERELDDILATTTTTTVAEGEEPTPTTIPEQPEPCDCFVPLLNSFYSHTRTWIRTYPDEPDPGMAALSTVVGRMLGLHIDHYVLVDFAGFVDVIDALGGVDVTVTEAMDVGFSPAKEGEEPVRVAVEPGPAHLDGREALAYVRNREGSSDYTRMTRQRCMLRSMADAADPVTVMRSFPSLAAAIESSTTTNIPLNVLPDLVRAVASLEAADIATVAFQPPYYTPEYDFVGAPIPDVDRIRATVRSVLVEGPQGVRGGDPECP
ncbi:MAG: LCP family protein [Acidimicrobiia bacterium]|nr:LCP family protein [Acidimicrobiia bacterium]